MDLVYLEGRTRFLILGYIEAFLSWDYKPEHYHFRSISLIQFVIHSISRLHTYSALIRSFCFQDFFRNKK
jgi:hypothetical protein